MDKPLPSATFPVVAHHFTSWRQQTAASQLGMWVFLVTEVMFFSGLFLAYSAYRIWYPTEFAAASQHLDERLGTINTGILLTSSLTMALAVWTAERRRGRQWIGWLTATWLLGAVFLAIKFTEYRHKFHQHLLPMAGWEFFWPEEAGMLGARAFFQLYLTTTGLHGLHMILGLACVGWIIGRGLRGWQPHTSNWLPNVGLYWHFVDLVWVYLFPLFYLVRP